MTGRPKLWPMLSECGKLVNNRSQAITHAGTCCSVGVPRDPEDRRVAELRREEIR